MCARLSGDAAEIQGATGLRVGIILQGFSSLFIGIVMSMCYDWKLTLVGIAFIPMVSISFFADSRLIDGDSKYRRTYLTNLLFFS